MSDLEMLDSELLERYPLPHHPEDSDKEDRGRILVVGGSRELAGAALLASIAALRAGAGKLQVATAESISIPLALAIPEARVIPHKEDQSGCIDRSAVGSIIDNAKAAQAVAIGSGLQFGPALDNLLDALFACGGEFPLVLDAAVLGSLAPRAEAVKAWKGGAILLPHPGEMARLLEEDPEQIARDPLAAARKASQLYGAVAVLKGQFSHIVAPDGREFRYRGGGVGLATSGSGDTLAGIVGGLCARGADPLTAALWGVYLHGEAGRRLTATVGRVGFLARELLDQIPPLMEGR